MLDSSISIYKNFQNLPQDIQQKILEFEKIYKSLEDLPKFFVKDTPTFIFKAMLIHGDGYDYSKVDYINNRTKIPIICPEHGDFEQIPKNHLRGQGCPKCAGNTKSNLEEFIEKAKIIHKNNLYKYTYDKFDYKGAHIKGTITCEKHGDFDQIPNSHLNGNGCPECAGNSKSNLKEFVEKAKIVHKDSKYKYTYDNFKYVNALTKGIINCEKHGNFVQSPYKHLRGQGCPECRKERQKELNRIKWEDKYKKGILYLIECWNDFEHFVKIGVTSKTVQERYISSKSMPYNYKILKEFYTDSKTVSKNERKILKLFKSYTPLISFGGASECLQLSEKDFIIDHLENILKL